MQCFKGYNAHVILHRVEEWYLDGVGSVKYYEENLRAIFAITRKHKRRSEVFGEFRPLTV